MRICKLLTKSANSRLLLSQNNTQFKYSCLNVQWTVPTSNTSICRCFCSHPKDTDGPPGRLKRYLVNKFVHMINKCETFVETKNPSVFKVYKTFKDGFADLMADTKSYYQISKEVWMGRELHTFSRKELVIYRQMPSQMLRATPLVIIAAMPGGVFIFPACLPLIYYYPKLFLTHHFWTQEQKREVYLERHTKRLNNFPLILDWLEAHCQHIPDKDLQIKMNNILQKLECSSHPTIREILEVKPIFEKMNFKIENLSITHARHLAKTFGFSMTRSKLVQQGLLLLHTDLAMLREGFSSMTEDEINLACFMRGLNPYGLKPQEKEAYLSSWIEISKEVDEHSMSLLLHGPVLLAINHPTNKNLVGGRQFSWRRKG